MYPSAVGVKSVPRTQNFNRTITSISFFTFISYELLEIPLTLSLFEDAEDRGIQKVRALH